MSAYPGRVHNKLSASITDRLLSLREQAGDDLKRHQRYHRLVNRYQRLLLRNSLATYRRRFRSRWQWLRRTPAISALRRLGQKTTGWLAGHRVHLRKKALPLI